MRFPYELQVFEIDGNGIPAFLSKTEPKGTNLELIMTVIWRFNQPKASELINEINDYMKAIASGQVVDEQVPRRMQKAADAVQELMTNGG